MVSWSLLCIHRLFKCAQSSASPPLLPKQSQCQMKTIALFSRHRFSRASFPCRATRSWLSTTRRPFEVSAAIDERQLPPPSPSSATNCLSSASPNQPERSDTQRRRFLIYVTRCGHILWLKGRRVRLIFGDG